MEAPSAHGHRVPWQGVLLAASLLTFWIPPVTAQLTVEPEPANVAEGKDVLLHAYLSEEPLKYDWYKGRRVDSSQLIISYRVDTQNPTTGPMFSSRETVYPNGSLLIRSVTKADTGDYSVLVLYGTSLTTEGGTGWFQVLEPVALPSIQASNTTVTEHKDSVILTCLTRDTGISILWLLNNQRLRLTDRMMLSQDNSSLTISPVRREDAGEYQCEVSNLVSSSRSDPLTLTVKMGGDTTGLSEGVIAVIVVGALAVVALVATLWCISVCKSGRTSDKRGLPEHQPPESTTGSARSGHSASSAPLHDTKPAVPIYQELLHPDTNIYCQVNPLAEVAS